MSEYAAAVTDTEGGALLRVRVSPRAKTTALAGLHGDAARVRVAAPPADGQANAALVDYLAGVLAVSARDVELVRGASGRDKTVRVAGLDARAVAARLVATGR